MSTSVWSAEDIQRIDQAIYQANEAIGSWLPIAEQHRAKDQNASALAWAQLHATLLVGGRLLEVQVKLDTIAQLLRERK